MTQYTGQKIIRTDARVGEPYRIAEETYLGRGGNRLVAEEAVWSQEKLRRFYIFVVQNLCCQQHSNTSSFNENALILQ